MVAPRTELRKTYSMQFRSAILFFAGFLVAGLWASWAAAQAPAPNVVFIMLDDLGPGEYSVYDNLQGLGQTSKIATPNINSLANNGMRFNNAHSATALCAPTRAALMAGAPLWQTNVRWGFGPSSLQAGQQSVGDLMQSAGYKTALLGKGHLGGQVFEVGSNNAAGNNFSNMANMDLDRPLKNGMKNHGYDYTFNMIAGIQARPYVFWEDDLATTTDANGNSTRITNANKATMTRQWDANYDDGVTEIWAGAGGWGAVDWKTRDVPQAMLNKAVNFMQDSVANSPNDPFFIHYNSVAGHWPYVAPDDVQVDLNGDGDTNDAGEFYEVDGYDGSGPAPDDRGTESMQMVSVSDAEVGVLKSYLEQTDDPRNPGHKLIDNTVIIYTSDNGGIGPNYTNQNGPLDRDEWEVYGHDSTGGLRDNKASHREGGHRVPFIVQWGDNIEAGSVRDQRVSNIDLMGTLAGITGQSLIDQGQGSHNLLPVLVGERDDTDPIRKNLVVEDTGGASDGQTSRKLYYEDDWKLDLGTNATNPNIFEVYDLSVDPAETNNLVNSPDQQVQDRISAMYANYLAERSATRMAPVFIGRNSSTTVADVAGYGDVQVEGVLSGNGVVGGDLDANNLATIRLDGSGGGAAASQAIVASQDIRLDDDDAQYNSGSRLSLGIDSDFGLQRSAVEFDLTAISLPANATVTDVELQFRVGFGWAPAVSTNPTIEAYPLTAVFDETSATWTLAQTGAPWATPGGDFDGGALLATGDGFNPDSVNSGDILTVAGAALTADVLASLTDSAYQLLLKYDDASELLGQTNAVWLDSLQKGSQAPQLVVNYTVPSGSRLLDVAGDFTQRSGSTLEIALGGTAAAGSDYGQLAVDGEIDLKGGELLITLDAGFLPSLKDTFTILDFTTLTGDFDTMTLPALGAGLAWDTSALLTTGQLAVVEAVLPGDYNNDGFVDTADYAVWRNNLGAPAGTLPNDIDDGPIGAAQLATWTANFGQSSLAGPASSSAASIPEPSSALLCLLATLAWLGRRPSTAA